MDRNGQKRTKTYCLSAKSREKLIDRDLYAD